MCHRRRRIRGETALLVVLTLVCLLLSALTWLFILDAVAFGG